MVTQTGGPESTGDRAFEVDIDDEAGRTTLRLTGALDAETSTVLWRELDELAPTGTVTIDLTDVDFVDSSGIGCLFKLHRCVADADGMLVATGASPALRHLMQATGLNRVIAILP